MLVSVLHLEGADLQHRSQHPVPQGPLAPTGRRHHPGRFEDRYLLLLGTQVAQQKHCLGSHFEPGRIGKTRPRAVHHSRGFHQDFSCFPMDPAVRLPSPNNSTKKAMPPFAVQVDGLPSVLHFAAAHWTHSQLSLQDLCILQTLRGAFAAAPACAPCALPSAANRALAVRVLWPAAGAMAPRLRSPSLRWTALA